MYGFKGNSRRTVSVRIVSWMTNAGLILASITFGSAVLAGQAQQDQAQQNQVQPQPGQPGQWGQAGPPPDAQNGQIPPPPADQGNDQNVPPPNAQDEGAPPPPMGPGAPEYPEYGPSQQGRAPYQPYPQQNQQYPEQMQQEQAEQAPPSGPLTIQAGTMLRIRTSEPLNSKKLQPGDYFQAMVAQNVYVGNALAIPRGSAVTGRVVDVKKAGDLKGSAGLMLQVTSLNLGGQSYPLASDTWSVNSAGKGGYTAGNAVGGAALGALVGAIAGGGPGAAIGAAAGTGVGLGASAATPGPRSIIPPESVLAFRLVKPVTVQPVSYQEAREIEQNATPPQQRYGPGPGNYPYPPPPGPYNYYAAPYAYGYPYPYPYAYGYPYPYAYAYPYPYYRGYYRRYWR